MRKESDSPSSCLICREEKPFLSRGQCDHSSVCLYCTMKYRILYNSTQCPVCNAKLPIVYIVSSTDTTPFAALQQSQEAFYEDDECDKTGIYYTDITAKEEALELRGYNCPIRNCRCATFENFKMLSQHLEKVHRRFYCSCCIRENKKFLSEMDIYSEDKLHDHIQYGEYDIDSASFISPPHPQCSYCNETFYNDEKLFKHMNQVHFICELCRMDKCCIFYEKLEDLNTHYNKNHYCCPFKECIADIHVSFKTEVELIEHLVTKHKVTNANDRLTEMAFGKNKKKDIIHSQEEFDFTSYVNKLKEESESYHKKIRKMKKKYGKKEEQQQQQQQQVIREEKIGEDGMEYVIQRVDNRNRGGRGRGGRGNRGRGRGGRGGNNNYNYYYHEQQNYYNNNNKFDSMNEYNETYNRYNDNYYKEDKKEDQQQQQQQQQQQSYKKNKQSYNNNNSNSNNNNNNNDKPQKQKKQQIELDYSFLFSFYVKALKNIIKNKIISESINEPQVTLPKETIYQLIIIIDKLDSFRKLAELTSLHTFGIDMEIIKHLKELICLGDCNEKRFHEEIRGLELKKMLIIYEYFVISHKKIDALFYKLDLEQIKAELYDEFIEKKNKEEKSSKMKDNFKYEYKKESISHLQHGERYQQSKPSLASVLNDDSSSSSHKKTKTKNNWMNVNDYNKKQQSLQTQTKSKLSMLLSEDTSSMSNNNKNKNTTSGGFNLKNYDLDTEFPELV